MRRRPHTQTSSLEEWLPPTDDMYHISEYRQHKGVGRVTTGVILVIYLTV